jgi:hypothetical protein
MGLGEARQLRIVTEARQVVALAVLTPWGPKPWPAAGAVSSCTVGVRLCDEYNGQSEHQA